MAGDTFTLDFFECDDEEDFARRLRLAVYGPWAECEPWGMGLQPWEVTALLPRLRRQLGNNPPVDRRRKAPAIGFVT